MTRKNMVLLGAALLAGWWWLKQSERENVAPDRPALPPSPKPEPWAEAFLDAGVQDLPTELGGPMPYMISGLTPAIHDTRCFGTLQNRPLGYAK